MQLSKLSNHHILNSKRLIFQTAAPSSSPSPAPGPAPSPTEADKAVLAEAARKAAEATAAAEKQRAIEAGRAKGRSEVTSPDNPADSNPKPEDKPRERLPAVPSKLQGIKLQGEPKDKGNGTTERPFKFGDLNLPGTITMPTNPDPTKKTTIVFNYVKDPANSTEQDKKILAELAKKGEQLGNTIVVTLQTPEGTLRVDRKTVDTMSTLVGDIEHMQEEMSRRQPPIVIPRASGIMHLSSASEQQKVTSLLEKYKKVAAATDDRATKAPQIAFDSDATLTANLQAAIDALNPAPAAEPAAAQDTAAATPDAGTSGGTGGGGGVGSGGGSSAGGGSSDSTSATGGGAATSSSESSDSSASGASSETAPAATTETATESADREPVTGKTLVISDSMMGGLKGNQIPFPGLAEKPDFENVMGRKQIVGSFTFPDREPFRSQKLAGKKNISMQQIVKNLDSSGELERLRGNRIVILGGTNDVGGHEPEKITTALDEMYTTCLNHGITVYACTIPPFKGYKDYDKNSAIEKRRLAVNEWIRQRQGINVIDLAAPDPAGLADPNDPTALKTEYAGPDHLHPSYARKPASPEVPSGNEKIAELINKSISEHEGKAKTTESGATVPASTNDALLNANQNPTFKPTRAEVLAADEWYSEILKLPMAQRWPLVGQKRAIPGSNNYLEIEPHDNHKGKDNLWGTPQYRPTGGQHPGVTVKQGKSPS